MLRFTWWRDRWRVLADSQNGALCLMPLHVCQANLCCLLAAGYEQDNDARSMLACCRAVPSVGAQVRKSDAHPNNATTKKAHSLTTAV